MTATTVTAMCNDNGSMFNSKSNKSNYNNNNKENNQLINCVACKYEFNDEKEQCHI